MVIQWWTLGLDSGVWLPLVHYFLDLPCLSADQPSLPSHSHQAERAWGEVGHTSCLGILYASSMPAPHQLTGARTLIPREILMGPGWVGCQPPVQLAWPGRSGHVQCKLCSSGLGPWKVPEKRGEGAVQKTPSIQHLKFMSFLPAAPKAPFLILLMTLQTHCTT